MKKAIDMKEAQILDRVAILKKSTRHITEHNPNK